MKKTILFVLTLLLIATLSVSVVSAKPLPKPHGSESITYAGDLTYESELQVTISGFKTYDSGYGPWIWLGCYVPGTDADTLVLSDVRAGFEGGYGYGYPFVLGPSARWNQPYPGTYCTISVGHQGNRGAVVDAAVSFDVVG